MKEKTLMTIHEQHFCIQYPDRPKDHVQNHTLTGDGQALIDKHFDEVDIVLDITHVPIDVGWKAIMNIEHGPHYPERKALAYWESGAKLLKGNLNTKINETEIHS
jgi:hypothetical protein